ncbi:unnamed protein product [Lupinus luteus]|uniref:Uncharacterized protein n=1 Tax=Lupinus luteus TaxID=3873 RepID=A0AAV1XNH5_LUPLU
MCHVIGSHGIKLHRLIRNEDKQPGCNKEVLILESEANVTPEKQEKNPRGKQQDMDNIR